ncbi:MAG: hydrogenase maturation protease [Planctomycetota bacterium]|nr:hydrogenase maturation protease [Planctomycetota bacterium]
MGAAEASVLLIGYGNPGRLDDGLGPALADAVDALDLPGVTVDVDYQLQPEDAAEIADHDVVIFADADVACQGPYRFQRIEPKRQTSFSSHSTSPQALLALAHEAFGASTAGYILGIRGEAFDDFGEGLSPAAQANLDAAREFIIPLLHSRDFETALTDSSAGSPCASSP